MASFGNVNRQSAVIPVLGDKVCLVLSRSGKRWVIPKGCMEPGKTAGEIGLQEAWEEAGLSGILNPDPIGTYCYEKDGRKYHVLVFVMNVTEMSDTWPESSWRQRTWVGFKQAAVRIEEYGLQEMFRTMMTARVG